MIDPEVELRRAAADTNNELVSSFEKPMRSGLLLNVEDGDVLEMPASLEAIKGKIIRHTALNDAESIMVKAHNADGVEKVVELFPSSITRVGIEYTKPAVAGAMPKRTGKVFPNTGDVVDACRACATIGEAMEKLYGKKIKFEVSATYTALRYGTTDTKETKSWVISFA